MRMLDIIARKREGGEHSPEELAFIARAAAEGSAPDYQLSAWLMAVCVRGMSAKERVSLTRAMARSGKTLGLSSIRAPKVDKHSTGGVGDGVSIVLAPLLAAAGVCVPMMSGRGLGHTGGTLDKLESIRGFQVRLSPAAILRQLRSIGVGMFGQSAELAPADRKLYALRDATSTVESLPLIVASILSKKLSEDLDALVLDVKCGSGAIFKDPRRASELAEALVRTANGLGVRCVGLLTGMEQPLGRYVGNALEIRQAVEILQGDLSSADYVEVTLALGGWMLALSGKARDWREGAGKLSGLLKNGKALDRFKAMVKAQGGDPRAADDPVRFLPRASKRFEFPSPGGGFLSRLDARLVGRAGVSLGAGRDRQEDGIDFGAGIILRRKVGDPVRKGECLAELFARDKGRLAAGRELFAQAVGVSRSRPRVPPVILKLVK